METKVDASRDSKGSRLFSLGQIVSTPGALAAMQESDQSTADFIGRHLLGDWGELCEEDKTANEDALKEDLRLMSVYRTLKLRGHDPLETIADALALQIATDNLPALPPVRAPDP